MKCPYRMTVIHEDTHTSGIQKIWARDVEAYSDCYKEECPYYEEHNVCRKVKAEVGLIDG